VKIRGCGNYYGTKKTRRKGMCARAAKEYNLIIMATDNTDMCVTVSRYTIKIHRRISQEQ
jgi:hypothetical protein